MTGPTGTWWKRLDSTAKVVVVLLTIAGIVGGWIVSSTTIIRVNAMAEQKSLDERARDREHLDSLEMEFKRAEADAAATKAATATSLNGIALTVEAQSQANIETARQVATLAKRSNDIAEQIHRTQVQLALVTDLDARISILEKVIPKLSSEVNDLTKATTKLRKKVREEPGP